MLRKSGSDSNLGLSFLALWLLVAAFPGLTLFQGQVIKQFETYSLARSMAEVGWNPLATTIPCDGGIRWVLEIPIFAGLGGLFARIAPAWPSVLPVLVFGIFLLALLRFRRALAPESSPLAWFAVAAAPVFLRFSTQFLADPLAVALVLLGASFFLERRSTPSTLLFLLAVSVKPTVLPAVLFFRWAFHPERGARAFLPVRAGAWFARELGLALGLLAPFALWSFTVRALEIPSPMHEGGLLAIGHDWAILAERAFYSKFFVWTVFKGVGVPLFAIGIYALYRADRSERTLRLAAWSVGILPYWFFVRRLNVVHDYYSLSFFLPIALLGALAADEFLRGTNAKSRMLAGGLLGATALQGIFLLVAQAQGMPWHPAVEVRPVFCGPEFRAKELMGLPPANGR